MKIPDNLLLQIPKGVYNIKDIFLWNGDNCIIQSSQRVFHKEMQTQGKGKGYTANIKTGQSDRFVPYVAEQDSNIYFYTANMGVISFSESCSAYENVRVVYEGFPDQMIDKVRFIPPFFREALVGYVTERAFFALKSRDVAYRLIWADAKSDLYDRIGTEQSKWDNALYLSKKVDKKKRQDMQEYLSKMDY